MLETSLVNNVVTLLENNKVIKYIAYNDIIVEQAVQARKNLIEEDRLYKFIQFLESNPDCDGVILKVQQDGSPQSIFLTVERFMTHYRTYISRVENVNKDAIELPPSAPAPPKLDITIEQLIPLLQHLNKCLRFHFPEYDKREYLVFDQFQYTFLGTPSILDSALIGDSEKRTKETVRIHQKNYPKGTKIQDIIRAARIAYLWDCYHTEKTLGRSLKND